LVKTGWYSICQLTGKKAKKGNEMKLIKNKEFLRNAANYIDVMNTLGGGIAESQVLFENRKKGSLLRVMVPGVSPEAFRVNLTNNLLAVSAVTAAENNGWTAPIFHQEFALPPQIALDQIRVVLSGRELQVRLPYYDATSRQLPIETDEE